MEINESILISQTPQNIWNFWMLVTEDIHWREGFIKAEWNTEPPFGIGSSGTHYHKDLGAMKWEITKYGDGQYFEFIHAAGKLKGSTAYFEVKPDKTGSRVSVHAMTTGPLFMRFMMLFMRGVIRKGMQEDLKRLKVLMEHEDAHSE